MRNTLPPSRISLLDKMADSVGARDPRHLIIGAVLVIALFAFEIFNFDTTRYALTSLLGSVTFLGLSWAAILAIAFCAIDFAGLAKLFTPEKGADEPKEVWYLMGAWLLGATMNAVMTWWAVSLTLLNHPLGNEILARETLLKVVPIFVAVLVWLTRILFIGSITVAGEHFFDLHGRQIPAKDHNNQSKRYQPALRQSATRTAQPVRSTPARRPAPTASFSPKRENSSAPVKKNANHKSPSAGQKRPKRTSRVRRRPPVPNTNGRPANLPVGMKANGRKQ